jgi:hypothetical protein
MGEEQIGSAVSLQKEILEAYAHSSSAWLARVQSEVQLWSELAAKLTITRTASEALEAYTKCVSQQMLINVEEGRRVFEECQQITQRISKSLAHVKPDENP